MPGRRGSIHQVGRRRAIRRVRADGKWYGYGPEVEDSVTGWLFPTRLMVQKRQGLVSRQFKDQSLDRPENY